MIKKMIIGGIFLSAIQGLWAQDTLFVCDFEDGIPNSFSVYDRDGNVPSRSMKRYGLEQGVAWAGYTDVTVGSVAVSGSWYQEAAQSDDWLITPGIMVKDARAILSWKACATDAEHPDGYSIYISDKGNSPEDFVGEPVLTVGTESVTWQDYYLPLEQYAGKEIYVAFVNNSVNCNLLMLDDITVFTRKHTFTFTNLTPEAVTLAGDVEVTGTLASSGFLPVEGYKLELTHGGYTYIIDHTDELLEPDETVTLTFDQTIPVMLNATEDYTLVISSMGGTDVDTIYGSITCFERTVLIEEGTGTWCMWCPRGQYGLQQLHKKRSGEFIDIAVHVSDPMMVYDYAMALYAPFFYTNGLPSCVMDRNSAQTGDPYAGVEEMLNKAKKQGAIGRFVDLQASVCEQDFSRFEVSGAYEFGKPVGEGEYRLSFILVEDSVTGYEQSNGYSGSSSAMGGLDLLPDPIPAGEYYFANVGRAVFDSVVVGLANKERLTIESQPERHTQTDFNYEFNYPSNISDVNKVKLVALIVDEQTGQVVNAAETKLSYFSGSSSIKDAEASSSIRMRTTSAGIELAAVSPICNVEVWSVEGQLLSRTAPDQQTYTLPIGGHNRTVIIVKVQTATGNATFKTRW